MTDETAVYSAGVTAASEQAGGTPQMELDDVKAWFKRINEARDFDKNARVGYAKCRRYASGDAGEFEVSLPIAGSYIDILKSFLYARDPDLDAQPADGTTPPPMSDILEMARKQLAADPTVMQQVIQAGQEAQAKAQAAQQQSLVSAILPAITGAKGPPPAGAAPPPGPDGAPAGPVDPQEAANEAMKSKFMQLVQAKADVLMEPYQQRQTDAKQLGQTLECVIADLWRKAALKDAAKPLVGSSLTIGPGWLKGVWHERVGGDDPITSKQLDDAQEALKRLDQQRAELDAGDLPNPDEARAALLQSVEGAQSKVDAIVARGLAIDFENGENIQLALGVPLRSYLQSPWIAHRIFKSMSDAKALFPQLCAEGCEKLSKAALYQEKKPPDPKEKRDSGSIADVDAKEADAYTAGSGNEQGQGSVCIWEVWNKQAGMVLTIIEGVDCYARAPYVPNPVTTRWYPFFLLVFIEADGKRHPVSMIERTQDLLDEMNRIYSNRQIHRRRCIPKTAFDSSTIEPKDVRKLEGATTGEMVGIDLLNPMSNLKDALVPVQYPAIDAALYDDGPTRAMLEMAWGIQEALSSSIQVAKTAHEAEIQQKGTEARTSFMRDALDCVMQELAIYSAEVAIQKLDRAAVQDIAGPWAFWPEATAPIGVQSLASLVNVSIRAGSSGKSDTTARQQTWAMVMPILQQAIQQVGQLRGSSPEQVADCIEELIAETLQRTGDKIDPARFLPGPPDNLDMPQLPPAAMQQPAITGPAPTPVAIPPGATLQ